MSAAAGFAQRKKKLATKRPKADKGGAELIVSVVLLRFLCFFVARSPLLSGKAPPKTLRRRNSTKEK